MTMNMSNSESVWVWDSFPYWIW